MRTISADRKKKGSISRPAGAETKGMMPLLKLERKLKGDRAKTSFSIERGGPEVIGGKSPHEEHSLENLERKRGEAIGKGEHEKNALRRS